MKTCLAAIAAASLAIALGTGGAFACGGSSVLFSDDFTFADPSWGGFAGTTIADGKMTIETELNSWYPLENQSGFFTDFDVCVDLVQHNDDPSNAWASILFWGTDYDNFYTFDVATNGFVGVSRLQNGRWLSPVAWTQTQNIVNPGDAVNSLRVVGVGNVATVFVNGQQIAKFRGQPPEGGSLLGVYGDASPTAPATYDFTNFVVTSADADLSAAPMEEEEAPPDEDTPPPVPKLGGSKTKSN